MRDRLPCSICIHHLPELTNAAVIVALGPKLNSVPSSKFVQSDCPATTNRIQVGEKEGKRRLSDYK